MQNDTEELAELREIYDELWSDAKTLAKDLKKNFSVYVYASVLTILIAIIIGLNFVGNLMVVLAGQGSLLSWYNMIMGAIGLPITIVYPAILLRWYRQQKKRYKKLIDIEKKLGEK